MHQPYKQYIVGKARLEAFSDGVIAIIITLMILEVKLPKVDVNATSAETWNTLAGALPSVMAYMLSFIMAGIYWVNHHNFLHTVKHADTKLLWYNLFFLFWLSLIPLPTGFLAEHYHKPEATALYGALAFMCAISFMMMTRYAAYKGNLMIDNISAQKQQKLKATNAISLTLYFISIFAGYVSVYISIAIFVMISAAYFLPQSLEAEDRFGE